jgi:hypothetical protein
VVLIHQVSCGTVVCRLLACCPCGRGANRASKRQAPRYQLFPNCARLDCLLTHLQDSECKCCHEELCVPLRPGGQLLEVTPLPCTAKRQQCPKLLKYVNFKCYISCPHHPVKCAGWQPDRKGHLCVLSMVVSVHTTAEQQHMYSEGMLAPAQCPATAVNTWPQQQHVPMLSATITSTADRAGRGM